MKNKLLKLLVLILALGICSTIHAQTNITIGEGAESTNYATPYASWWNSFRQQYLIHAAEIFAAGGGPGNINSVAFNVQQVLNVSPMPGFMIRMKHTNQTELVPEFELGEYQTVYEYHNFAPTTTGWIVHNFSTPFNWDGESNIIVEVSSRFRDELMGFNSYVYCTNTDYASSLRFQSLEDDGLTGTSGTLRELRANMKFNMQALVPTSPPNPALLVLPRDGTFDVIPTGNLEWKSGGGVPSGYKVYLGTDNPPPFVGETTATSYPLPSDIEPETVYYWRVIPTNIIGEAENCPVWSFTTANQYVTIGYGNEFSRLPIEFKYTASLFECIYYPDEFGFSSGTITSLAFYNLFIRQALDQNIQIWLGSTERADLQTGGMIPSTQLQMVFDGNVDFPLGSNMIHILFDTPYEHEGGNLVMMVYRPRNTLTLDSEDGFYCQSGPQTRARIVTLGGGVANINPASPPPGTTKSIFPKTSFFYTGESINMDLEAYHIIGNTTPSVGKACNYLIHIRNNGVESQSNYQVKLYQEGDIEIGTVTGPEIGHTETLQIPFSWTPTSEGSTYLYAKVFLDGDTMPHNNVTANYNVDVKPEGTSLITVGNGGSFGRMPIAFFYQNSLFETIYLRDELDVERGLLEAIQLYNKYDEDFYDMPVNIWMGETNQTDLTYGWIPSTQLTQVFDGTLDIPSGQNDILIPLTTPYPYEGGNLVMMVQRPWENQFYWMVNHFEQHDGVIIYRTRFAESDAVRYNPASPPTNTVPQRTFPKTSFVFSTEGLGSVSGTVRTLGAPMIGATVAVNNTLLRYTTAADGNYEFPFVEQGLRQITTTKYGYQDLTLDVNVVEGENVSLDFNLVPIPLVTVTGRVVGSDNFEAGLNNATIKLNGYENYQTTTNAQGFFTIPNVYSDKTYSISIKRSGYREHTGNLTVESSNVDMGDIILRELSNPPRSVVATEAFDFSKVSVAWLSPATNDVGQWIHYDSGNNVGNKIGTGSAVDFDAVIRYPASALTSFAGMSLQAVKVWPADPGEFSIRVWTGGTAAAPENLILEQPFTPAPLNTYNTVTLNEPVLITGTEELWFGLRSVVTGGYPVGCDTGPAADGFGNMMHIQGSWATLLDMAPDLNYNWNIQGYVGHSAPSRAPQITLASFDDESDPDRALEGYQVFRFLSEDAYDESSWEQLTDENISTRSFVDHEWSSLPIGKYKYAVKAHYTNFISSGPSFSNEIPKGMNGVLTGIVTDIATNLPIAGARVTAGEYSGITNSQGRYEFFVYRGTYEISCVKAGYSPWNIQNMLVVGNQSTTLNIALTEGTLPPRFVTAENAGNAVNLTWSAPPSEGGEWLQYTTQASNGSLGINGGGTFSVAARFPASVMRDYEGQSLRAVRFWPADTANFTIQVWSGGNAAAPAVLRTEQAFTPETLKTYNTVVLDHPVVINGNEELWFGYSVTHGPDRYPAGTDNGPVIDGFGNLINPGDGWVSLMSVAPTYDVNWCLQGFVGHFPPTDAPAITSAIVLEHGQPSNEGIFAMHRDFAQNLETNSRKDTFRLSTMEGTASGYRAHTGYKIWRLLAGEENNETAWIQITPNNVTGLGWQENQWNSLPSGEYRWAVKSVYTGNNLSQPAFSNTLFRETSVGLEAPELSVVKTATGFALSWNEVAGATVYHIYRSTDPFGTFDFLDSTTNLGFEDNEIQSKAFYHVKAVQEQPLSSK